MGAAYSSLGRTKVLYATSLVLRGAKAKFLRRKPSVLYHRDFLHKFWFNDFNISLILSLIKISTLKIVQLLRYSQGNTQSIFYVIISNLLFLFPQ